jgi:hypothetical protein
MEGNDRVFLPGHPESGQCLKKKRENKEKRKRDINFPSYSVVSQCREYRSPGTLFKELKLKKKKKITQVRV